MGGHNIEDTRGEWKDWFKENGAREMVDIQ